MTLIYFLFTVIIANLCSVLKINGAKTAGTVHTDPAVYADKLLPESHGNNVESDYAIEAHNVTIQLPQLSISQGSGGGSINLNGSQLKAELLQLTKGQHNGSEQELRSDLSSSLIEYPELASSLNYSIDLCSNFYQFVCSGFLNRSEIAEDRQSYGQFTLIDDKVNGEIEAIFEHRKGFKSLPPHDSLIFLTYDKCMDNTSRNALRSRPLLDRLAFLKSTLDKSSSMTDWLVEVFPTGLFYSIYVGGDPKNVSNNILTIISTMPELGNEKYYLEDEFSDYVEALETYLKSIITTLLEDDKGEERRVFRDVVDVEEEIKRRVESFMKVDMEVARIRNVTERNYDDEYANDIHITVKEFQDNYTTSTNWTQYLTSILPDKAIPKEGVENMTVYVRETNYLLQIEEMVQQLDKQVLSDFMDWQIILAYTSNLDDRFEEIEFNITKTTTGEEKPIPRAERCRGLALRYFAPLVDRYYIKKYFHPMIRKDMENMFEEIQHAFQGMLMATDWMDNSTKQEALKKLDALRSWFGYFDAIFHDASLKASFDELHINGNMSLVELIRNASLWSSRNTLKKLDAPVDFYFASFDINGYYEPLQNVLIVTAGILQMAFYNRSIPAALNYGSIGFVLGHEIIHGYDNGGSLHDSTGNVRDWWDNSTKSNFNAKKQCFIEQYGNVSIQIKENMSLSIDGELTQGENIADNGGLKAAFLAFKQSLAKRNEAKDQPETRKIKGMDKFSEEQLFFVGFAYSFCTKQRPESLSAQLVEDPHTPDEQRINLALANSPHFAEVFHCPIDSPMNPKSKCEVW